MKCSQNARSSTTFRVKALTAERDGIDALITSGKATPENYREREEVTKYLNELMMSPRVR